MPPESLLSLTVNGERIRRLIPSNRSLLDFIRDDIDLTGSKHGCDVGDCGACTVRVDGVPRLACITLAMDCDGASVQTIEGLAVEGRLHPIQDALHRHVAAQCGYCTPGIAMCLAALADENPNPSMDAIKEALSANICRCTGYTKILAAASEVLRPDTPQAGKATGGAS
ncbi:MAG: carbon-monoxide dehydrogenase small subunit [Myxococcota bacterium]|jgi:carbon-monoxide dehydrogenase small subunit